MKIISHAANLSRESGLITLEKINGVLNSPADMVEVDLSLTKDKELICYKKQKINGFKINGLTLEQIRRLNPSILTIQEVFDFINGKMPILMDIKDHGEDYYKLFSALLNNFETSDYNYLIAESSSLRLLNELKKARSDIETCLKIGFFSNLQRFNNGDTESLGAIALQSRYFQDTNDYMLYKPLLEEHQKMYVLSYNYLLRENPELFQKYIFSGCDGIVTDEVMELARRLNR